MGCLWRMDSWSQMIRGSPQRTRWLETNKPYKFLSGSVPEATPTSRSSSLNVRSPVQQSRLLPPYRLPQHVSPPRPRRHKLRETGSPYGGLSYFYWGQTPSSASPHGPCARLPSTLVTQQNAEGMTAYSDPSVFQSCFATYCVLTLAQQRGSRGF
jgi:hypothetical protein